MINTYSISLKCNKGERIYLKSFSKSKDSWTTEKEERLTSPKWDEIEDIYNELLDRVHRYEQRQNITHMPLEDYLMGQPGNLDILETRRNKDEVVTRRRVEMK